MSMKGLMQMIRAQRRIKAEEERIKVAKEQNEITGDQLKHMWSGTRLHDKGSKCNGEQHVANTTSKEKMSPVEQINESNADTSKTKKPRKTRRKSSSSRMKPGRKAHKKIKKNNIGTTINKKEKTKSKTKMKTKTANFRVETATMVERYLGSPLEDRSKLSPETGSRATEENVKSCPSNENTKTTCLRM